MSKMRPIKAAAEASENIQNKAKGLLPWLDHHTCGKCGSVCEAREEYVERQAYVMPVWVCENCGSRYHRDEKKDSIGFSFELWE